MRPARGPLDRHGPGGVRSRLVRVVGNQIAARPEMAGKQIVFMVCDSGERYMSTPLADELLGK